MQSLRAKNLAPIFGDDKKIEVSIEAASTIVRLFDWVDGLGWSCQKTLTLDSAMVNDLHRALTAVRCQTSGKTSSDDGKVIDFPTIK